MMKFLVVFVLLTAILSVECKRPAFKKGGPHLRKRLQQPRCFLVDGVKTNMTICEYLEREKNGENIEMCVNKRMMNRMGTICASNNQTYYGLKGKAEMLCMNETFVHTGKCGDCSDENFCPNPKNRIQPKNNRKANRKITDTEGNTYENMCEFKKARCVAFQEGKDLPVTQHRNKMKKIIKKKIVKKMKGKMKGKGDKKGRRGQKNKDEE